MVDLLVALLALAGLFVSSYFTGVAWCWFAPDVRWVPQFCRLDERTCASVVFTPQARLLGVPNSLLGVLWYAVVLLGVASGWLWRDPYHTAYVAASAVTLAFAAYLSYALVRVLRVSCRLCFASHGINAALFVILVAAR